MLNISSGNNRLPLQIQLNKPHRIAYTTLSNRVQDALAACPCGRWRDGCQSILALNRHVYSSTVFRKTVKATTFGSSSLDYSSTMSLSLRLVVPNQPATMSDVVSTVQFG